MLSKLFQASDTVFLMSHTAESKQPKFEFHGTIERLGDFKPQYFSINPIDRDNNRNVRGVGTQRASINVTAFRNFLFEIDTLPLDKQEALLRFIHLQLPLATVTFSGSSSLHAIISVADTLPFKPHTSEGINQYSQAWRALNTHLTRIASEFLGLECPSQVFDPSCKDPARLSRTPGAIRPDTLKVQQSLDGFGGYISSDEILNLMRAENFGGQQLASPVDLDPEMGIADLERKLNLAPHKGLKGKIEYPEFWADSDNMYPRLFQLTLWVIDATGAPLNTTLKLMQTKVFPAIKAAGYPRNPEIAIYNAYDWKGLS